jgi:hypothetical protein
LALGDLKRIAIMEHPKEIKLNNDNLNQWPAYKKLVEDGKIVFDARGNLRYPHGAPVGKLVLIRMRNDGTPVYQESAEDWFDPDSPAAENFVWPE